MAAGFPTSITVEVELTAGVWTAITTYVKSWSISQGSEDGSVAGGQLNLTLDNFDGRFLPDNATATYYPNFVEGKAIRFTAVKGATTSTRFFGWITGIEPDYPSEQVRSLCQVTALDTIGIASRTKAKPMPWAAVARLRTADAGFYPLTDKSARNGFGDVYGNMSDFTARAVSTTGSVRTAGDDSFSTDTDPCVQLSPGRSIWHASSAFGMNGDGLICFYVKPVANSTGTILQVISASTDAFILYDSSLEQIVVNSTESVSGGSNVPAAADQWHAVAVVVGGAGITVYVDEAASVVAALGSGVVTRLEFGSDISMSVRDVYIQPSNGGLSVTTFKTIYVNTGGVATSTLTEQADYWEYILGSVVSFTSLPIGFTATGVLTGGRSALESLNSIAASQSGFAYCSYTSTSAPITILSNADSRPTTVALTVDAELDTLGGPALSRGLIAQVAEARTGSRTGESVARDSTAAAALDATSVEVETVLYSDATRRAISQDILAQSQNSKQRITAITLDLVTAATDRYAAFFALQLGNRVRVTNLSSTYFGITYWDGYVTGWTEEGDGDRDYRVTLSLAPADAPPEGLWGDSTYGRWGFGDGICTVTSGTAVGTTSTGTMTLTWTGSATLSTSAGDYPMDFDWNGERVTVTSAPAGGTSPRTLTITARGVAPTVARSHAANEPIDIWNAARWAK